MLAPDYSSDEENDATEKQSTQGLRSISGDDLGDSFSLEEQPRTKKGWVDEILERRDENNSESEAGDSSGDEEESDEDQGDEEESDEDNEEGKSNLSLKDWEQSDDDNLDTDLEDDKEEVEEELDDDDDSDEQLMGPRDQKKVEKNAAAETSKRDKDTLEAKKIKADGRNLSTQADLPYLIEAPTSFEELSTLLDNRSNTEIVLIINRIRASNAIKLAAENRKKMQV
jgi:nucleolar protein 14